MLGRAATVRVMSSVTPRAALSALPDYAAGRPPQPVDGLEAFKLSSNENPWGPVPAAQEAIAYAAQRMHRDPDPTAAPLRERIAQQPRRGPNGEIGLVDVAGRNQRKHLL